MSYDLGQFITISRAWETRWVKSDKWWDRPTEKELAQSWYVNVPVECDECSYWHDEFKADTREGLIEVLRAYKSDEIKRINEIIKEVEALDEIGEPSDYLKRQVGEEEQ